MTSKLEFGSWYLVLNMRARTNYRKGQLQSAGNQNDCHEEDGARSLAKYQDHHYRTNATHANVSPYWLEQLTKSTDKERYERRWGTHPDGGQPHAMS